MVFMYVCICVIVVVIVAAGDVAGSLRLPFYPHNAVPATASTYRSATELYFHSALTPGDFGAQTSVREAETFHASDLTRSLGFKIFHQGSDTL